MSGLVAIMIVVQFFLSVNPAYAQFAVTDPGAVAQRESIYARQEVKTSVSNSIYTAALSALVSGASYFMRKLAYDAALAIATAGSGQKPLAITSSPGDYIAATFNEAGGAAIEDLGNSFKLNLCRPPDLRIQVNLQISLRRIYDIDGGGVAKPNCTVKSAWGNWKDIDDMYTGDELLSRFNAGIRVEESDFGIALGAIAKLDRIQAKAKDGAEGDLATGQGFKPLTDLISGRVKTPSQVIKSETDAVTAKSQKELSLSQITGIYGSGAAQILPVAGSVFLNTLTSQLLDRALKRGLFATGPGDDETSGGGGSNPQDFYGGTFANNRKAAQQAFNFLYTAVPGKPLNVYPILSEFVSCPENPGLNNCVIDRKMQELIELGSTQQPLTIAQAIERGYLDRNKQLISSRREVDNADFKNCRDKGYCQSNLQKLRKLRIFPLGFEIAALRSDPDAPWTLGGVVDNFENCQRDVNGNAVLDLDKHPFCHLIDPNWIIRLPEPRCETSVVGSERADGSTGERARECVDISTCIAEGPNGECLPNAYGYCTKEKNIWRLGGDVCQAQFATCKTYVNTETGAIASYLSRTVDYGECTPNDAGCRAYSLEQRTGTDKWIASSEYSTQYQQAGRKQTIYFNENVKNDTSCNGADGCTAFVPAQRDTVYSELFATNADGLYTKNTDKNALVHLKKAPGYLGCYDMNPSTPTIDWPVTISDVATKVQHTEACNAFAQACVKDEVGCDAFTPANGGPVIPGIIGANSCPMQCVGYNAYKQEGGKYARFDKETYPVYLIPPTADNRGNARTCLEQYAGCDEFTNLETAAAGGESREYYTDLKYCEKPTGDNKKVFYSWEGSTQQGYVLRTHTLLQISQETAGYVSDAGQVNELVESFLANDPAYHDMTIPALLKNVEACNKTVYERHLSGEDDPASDADVILDCRALYDDTGRITYRLLSQTVTVSDQCKTLRKTETVLEPATYLNTPKLCGDRGGFWTGTAVAGKCEVCMGGGIYQDGACTYKTIASEAKSCRGPSGQPDLYKGCRLYSGNGGNNIQNIFLDEFESGVSPRGDWSFGTVVAEASQVGMHSLQIPKGSVGKRVIASLARGSQYELSFWVKGAPQNLEIEITNTGTAVPVKFTASGFVTIGETWQVYRFSADISSVANPEGGVTLWMRRADSSAGDFYIDNVQLRRVNDTYALIKDSWTIPTSCDSTPEDGRPGEMLGCMKYTDSDGDAKYATSFQKLCREEAVGCQPLFDTFNTTDGADSELEHAYNVPCEAAAGEDCKVQMNGVPETEWKSCRVQTGKDKCYVLLVVVPAGRTLNYDVYSDESTVIVPADTAVDKPIFLTNKKEYRCNSFEKGCQKVGLEEKNIPVAGVGAGKSYAYSHSDTYIVNNPDKYIGQGGTPGILCRNDLVGCTEFRQGGTTVSYFKDPIISGNALCEYRPLVTGGTAYGWFMKGVGTCNNDNTKLCGTSADCGTGGTCVGIGSVACYDNNIAQGGERGIWSNKSAQYRGLVGVCPSTANLCTELVDARTKNNPDKEPEKYYVIYDKNLTDRQEECEGGQVSLKEGCVLFDKTDEANKVYNSSETYKNSTGVQDGFVPAVITGTNEEMDSNVVLKVDRDRTCAEWLSCRTSIPQTNEKGTQVNLCYQLRACTKMENGKCTQWVEEDSETVKQLTQAQYVSRDTGWDSIEYSGYSLFDKRPIASLTYLSLDSEDPTTRVAFEYDSSLLEDIGTEDVTCTPTASTPNTDWKACGPERGGRCYRNRCLYPLSGTFSNSVTSAQVANSILVGGSCKGYPESDSPYPADVMNGSETAVDGRFRRIQKNLTPKPGYTSVNFCQNGECSCAYKKIRYTESAVDYWPISADASIPAGVCSGGVKDGYPCTTQDQCKDTSASGNNGTCVLQTANEQFYGLYGYCLEPDLSRPIDALRKQFACLTWLPIDVSASKFDLRNANVSAGYNPSIDAGNSYGQAYCTVSTKVGQGVADTSVPPGAFNLVVRPTGSNDVTLQNAGVFTSLNSQDLFDAYQHYGFHIPRDNRSEYSCAPGMLSDLGDNRRDISWHPILDVMCRPRAPYAYGAMQIWAWGNAGQGALGAKAVVLRHEAPDESRVQSDILGGNYFSGSYGVYNNRAYSSDWSTVSGEFDVPFLRENSDGYVREIQNHPYVLNSGEFIPCQRCSVYHFAPAPVDSGENVKGYGTVMHPPRVWGSASSLGRPNDFIYTQTPVASQGERTISSVYMSPEKAQKDGYGEAQSLVYRSDIESKLRETDLDRVYFVPTAMRNGSDGSSGKKSGIFPVPFTQKIYIDVGKLRGLLEGGNMAKASASWSLPSEETVGNESDERLAVWAYALQKGGSDGGLLSFDSYDYLPDADGSLLAAKANPRNDIYRRYVVVVAEQEWPVLSVYNPGGSSRPPRSDFEPFTVSGGSGCNAGSNNWLAVGMDFNRDGEFLGYISRWCNGGATVTDSNHPFYNSQNPVLERWIYGDGMRFTVIATLQDQCTEFAQVYDETQSFDGTTNKAWTQRVWKYNRDSDDATDSTGQMDHPLAVYGQYLKWKSQWWPFGSVGVVGHMVKSFDSALKGYSFSERGEDDDDEIAADGIPYACRDKWKGYPVAFSGENECGGLTGIFGPNVAGELGNRTEVDAYRGVQQLFAKVFSVVGYDSASGVLINATTTVGNTTVFDRARTISTDASDNKSFVIDITSKGGSFFPQVYSLNPTTCFSRRENSAVDATRQSTDSSVTCVAGEANNITINGRNGLLTDYNKNPDIVYTEEDSNFDRQVDQIIAVGSYSAVAQFFAFADDNKMPLRSVKVDWGDGNLAFNADVRGMYKNHKPFCAQSDTETSPSVGVCQGVSSSGGTVTTLLTCQQNTDCPQETPSCFKNYIVPRFGNAPRACEPGYFEFINEYSCGARELRLTGRKVSEFSNTDTKKRLIALGLSEDKSVCVFKPKVQVTDNWDWCNGSCYGTNTGCYQNEDADIKQCAFDNNKAWTSYRGEIIVLPQRTTTSQ